MNMSLVYSPKSAWGSYHDAGHTISSCLL